VTLQARLVLGRLPHSFDSGTTPGPSLVAMDGERDIAVADTCTPPAAAIRKLLVARRAEHHRRSTHLLEADSSRLSAARLIQAPGHRPGSRRMSTTRTGAAGLAADPLGEPQQPVWGDAFTCPRLERSPGFDERGGAAEPAALPAGWRLGAWPRLVRVGRASEPPACRSCSCFLSSKIRPIGARGKKMADGCRHQQRGRPAALFPGRPPDPDRSAFAETAVIAENPVGRKAGQAARRSAGGIRPISGGSTAGRAALSRQGPPQLGDTPRFCPNSDTQSKHSGIVC